MYGDSYLPYDYQSIEKFFKSSDKLSLMTVYKNQNRFDKSNVIIQEGLVKVYDKSLKGKILEHIDAGLSILRKEILNLVPSDGPYDLQELYKILVSQEEISAYEVKQRFYQIGSIEGLEEFKELVERGVKTV
jgi:NDP-sugar pyrophosphorylase family protein